MRTSQTLRWAVTTLLVIVAMAVMVRLGIWQLDRLAERRAFNARVMTALAQPVLDLNQELPVDELYDMEYRSVVVRGMYFYDEEILLRNQVWDGQLGFHVLTPLQIDGTVWAVLVDRGWLPYDQARLPQREAYREAGEVTVRGVIRRGKERPDFGGIPDPTLAPGETRLEAWNLINLKRIQEQVSQPLLPVYIQQAPDAEQNRLPYRSLPDVEITEGPHLGYAIQWFTFAAILGIGYPFFVRHRIRSNKRPSWAEEES